MNINLLSQSWRLKALNCDMGKLWWGLSFWSEDGNHLTATSWAGKCSKWREHKKGNVSLCKQSHSLAAGLQFVILLNPDYLTGIMSLNAQWKLVCQQNESEKDRVECIAACSLCFLFHLVFALFFFFSVCCLDLWGRFVSVPLLLLSLSDYAKHTYEGKCRWVTRIASWPSYFSGVDE